MRISVLEWIISGAVGTYEEITRTPPFKPLSKVPFPRPPARTWALMTISSPPSGRQHPSIAVNRKILAYQSVWQLIPLLGPFEQLHPSGHLRRTGDVSSVN